jgi:hypothetical protein
MKPITILKRWALCLSLALYIGAITTGYGQSKGEVEVINGSHNGWTITAHNQILAVSPSGTLIPLSDVFVTPNWDLTPIQDITCVWGSGPKNSNLVAIFSQEKRASIITIFDTDTGDTWREIFPERKFPAWYGNVYKVETLPPTEPWDSNTMKVTTNVTLRDGKMRPMEEVLVLDRATQTFSLEFRK